MAVSAAADQCVILWDQRETGHTTPVIPGACVGGCKCEESVQEETCRVYHLDHSILILVILSFDGTGRAWREERSKEQA